MKFGNIAALRQDPIAARCKLGTTDRKLKESLKVHEQRQLNHVIKRNCPLVLRNFSFGKSHFYCSLSLLNIIPERFVNSENLFPDIIADRFQNDGQLVRSALHLDLDCTVHAGVFHDGTQV